MLVGALYRSMNQVLAKVSQLSRAYPVNVLAFDKVHPQWKTSSKSRGNSINNNLRFGISWRNALSQFRFYLTVFSRYFFDGMNVQRILRNTHGQY